LDTAGHYPWLWLEKILPHIDIVLFDLKIYDDVLSKKWIGATTELIKTNYKKLIQSKKRVWVRTPVIPTTTASNDNIANIGQFIKENGIPERWELCAFNNLPVDKYERLDQNW
jgi:pyruvate formate lyase activating enzyme